MNKPVSIRGVRLSCSHDRSFFPQLQQILQVAYPAGAGKRARADGFVVTPLRIASCAAWRISLMFPVSMKIS